MAHNVAANGDKHPTANCDPPVEKLPLERPILMGGEEEFRELIRTASLPRQIKAALCKDGVYIKRPEYVVAVLQKMVSGGLDCFQVVSDFDQTLTRYHRDGKYSGSCYSILSRNRRLPQKFLDDSIALHDKYVVIELDPTMSAEEKIPHMKDWWIKQHDLFLGVGLKSQWITEMVNESAVEFRDRCDELFLKLDQFGIPLLIYSAGIENLITEVLKERSVLKKTSLEPLIVANQMIFDDEGNLKGFREELIHTFNKNEIFPHHRDYFAKHGMRRNVLLMGDMLGDLQMADGMTAKENVLTIGFLNSKINESFNLYRDNFDIVLIDDQTIDIPIAILDGIGQSR